MRGCIILIACIFVTSILPQIASASSVGDPCSFFEELNLPNDHQKFSAEVKKIISSIINFASNPNIDKIIGNTEPMFTSSSGFGFQLSCDPDEPSRRLERNYYFPVGMIVYPIGQRKFNKNINYYYVTTEHGHNIFIEKNKLKQFDNNKIYIFHQGPNPIGYCAGTSCPDEKKHELVANSSYATTNRNKNTMLVISNKECQTLSIQTFYKNGKPTKLNRAQIETCNNNEFNNDLRYVSLSGAKRKGKKPIIGYYNSTYLKKLQRITPAFLWTKGCNQEMKLTGKFSLGGSLAGKLEKLGFCGKGDVSGQIEKKYAHGKYIVFSSYIARGIIAEKNAAFDIVSISDCKGTVNPKSFETLNIYIGDADNDLIPINEEAITQSMKNKGYSTGLKWSLRKDAALMEGRHWAISGYRQYFQWVSFWKQELNQFFKSKKYYENMKQDDREMFLAFFSHLIISASFDFLDENEAQMYKTDNNLI